MTAIHQNAGKLIKTSGNVIPVSMQAFTQSRRRPSPTLPPVRCHPNMPRWFNICLLHAFAGSHVIKQEATATAALINHHPWRTIMPGYMEAGTSEATDYTHCLIKTLPAEEKVHVFLFIGLLSFADAPSCALKWFVAMMERHLNWVQWRRGCRSNNLSSIASLNCPRFLPPVKPN